MGDEAYAALLPWIVFCVVDRVHGQGVTWASVAAIAAAMALLATRRRHGSGTANAFMYGTIGWFSILGTVGWFFDSPAGWLARNGRGVATGGCALLLLGSLAFTPATDYYTRLQVRSSTAGDPSFDRINTALTLLWAAAFGAMTVSYLLAPIINKPSAYTTFNWVVPVALLSVAAHRSRVAFENFLEDDVEDRLTHDPLWDLSVDWNSKAERTDG